MDRHGGGARSKTTASRSGQNKIVGIGSKFETEDRERSTTKNRYSQGDLPNKRNPFTKMVDNVRNKTANSETVVSPSSSSSFPGEETTFKYEMNSCQVNASDEEYPELSASGNKRSKRITRAITQPKLTPAECAALILQNSEYYMGTKSNAIDTETIQNREDDTVTPLYVEDVKINAVDKLSLEQKKSNTKWKKVPTANILTFQDTRQSDSMARASFQQYGSRNGDTKRSDKFSTDASAKRGNGRGNSVPANSSKAIGQSTSSIVKNANHSEEGWEVAGRTGNKSSVKSSRNVEIRRPGSDTNELSEERSKRQNLLAQHKGEYNVIFGKHRAFFTDKNLTRDEIGIEYLKDLLQYVEDAERQDGQMRHHFLIQLTKTDMFSMKGPVTGFFTKLVRQGLPDSSSIESIVHVYGSIIRSVLQFLEELIVRVPHLGSTMMIVATISALVKQIPNIDKSDLAADINKVDNHLKDPSLMINKVNDPTHNWSSDLAFIGKPLLPPIEEIISSGNLPKKFTNLIDRPFGDSKKYIEIWFRLMREDFVSPLRTALTQFRSLPVANMKSCKRVDEGYLYVFSGIVETRRVDGRTYIQLDFLEFKMERLAEVDWCITERLRSESLIVLSKDKFKTARYGTVQCENKQLQFSDERRKGLVWVRLLDNDEVDFTGQIHGLEPIPFWEPYRAVLERIKVLAGNVDGGLPIPMERYLVKLERNMRPPAYLCHGQQLVTRKNGMLTIGEEGAFSVLNMDESQQAAMELALTHELALIQGPPGTGKSYVGAHLVDILIMNRRLWQTYDHGCIMLVSYTNHAIDQFVDECEQLGMDMSKTVRLGARGNESMAKYLMRNRWNEIQEMPEYAEIRRENWKIRKEIKNVEATYNKAQAAVSADFSQVSFETYNMYISEDINHQFLNENAMIDMIDEDENHEGEKEKQFVLNDRIVKKWMSGNLTAIDFQNIEPMTKYEARVVKDIFSLEQMERRRLFAFWCQSARIDAEPIVLYFKSWLEKLYRKREEQIQLENRTVLQRADIIAMTTTGASKHSHLVDLVQPTIVLVEEAAEVLESHIVAPLTQGCQHLILIGDHQQLRPSISEYRLQREKRNLDVSLFERLAKNDIPNRCLHVQHRMHPEIAEILVPHIYSSLEHHQVVTEYPEVLGMKRRLGLKEHTHSEARMGEKSSYKNPHEARYIVALCRYLLQQGYLPEDITILTTYMGQRRLIKSLLTTGLEDAYDEYSDDDDDLQEKANDEIAEANTESKPYKESNLAKVRVTTVDNYQGEENKIILLSFVRSNKEKKIGFLKWSNRICVALSRAKHGFYAVGDFFLYAQVSDIWEKLCSKLTDGDDPALISTLELVCQQHGTIIDAIDEESFENLVPEGGCTRKCEYRLQCGHSCTRYCHPDDREHRFFKCVNKCPGFLNCGHKCERECWTLSDDQNFNIRQFYRGEFRTCDSCFKKIDCNAVVDIKPICNHPGRTECSDQCNYACMEEVVKELPCGHTTRAGCSIDVTNEKCNKTINVIIPSCGHELKRKCYRGNAPCDKQVSVDLPQCGHTAMVECYKRRDDVYCEVLVKVSLPCKHSMKVKCSSSKKKLNCMENVTVQRKCGKHLRQVACFQKNEPDLEPCMERVQIVFECGRHTLTQPCFKKVPTKCVGHVSWRRESCEHYVNCPCAEAEAEMAKPCDRPVKTYRPCGHFVTRPCHKRNQPFQGRCNEQCSLSCSHGVRCIKHRCRHQCKLCKGPCPIGCIHTQCTRKCHEDCDRNPCDKPCTRKLNCLHPCQGLCGELCPSYCPQCLKKGGGYHSMRIKLKPCNHEVELGTMEKNMEIEGNMNCQVVTPRYCPKNGCERLVVNCPRYGNYIKRYLRLMKRRDYSEKHRWLFCKICREFFKTSLEDPLPEKHDCEWQQKESGKRKTKQEEIEEEAEESDFEDEQVQEDVEEVQQKKEFRVQGEEWVIEPTADMRNNPFFQKMAKNMFANARLGRRIVEGDDIL